MEKMIKKMKNRKNFDELKIDDTQESDKGTQSCQESWWSSWNGLSQQFDSKGEKKEFSSDDEEEDQWWKSFCSQSTQKVKLSNLKVVVRQNIKMNQKVVVHPNKRG